MSAEDDAPLIRAPADLWLRRGFQAHAMPLSATAGV
jgi:hypothetical protein